ncbi:MAG TPA: GNAT family N-acetyltransferase [Geodermatophilus sp.]|nr:GNAT family N-acetyltransferase [Geodermatophilus sp.]
MDADVEISPASPDEAERLLTGARETYATGLRTQRGLSAAEAEEAEEKAARDVAAQLPDEAATGGQHLLVARRGAELLGGIWVAEQGPDRPGEAWIYHLWVQPAARRQGVGRALVDAAGAVVRQRGAHRLGLNVFGDNAGAIALYQALGFSVTAQQMTLPLTSDT